MATLRIDVDIDTFERLTKAAVIERRPLPSQASILLRQALLSPLWEELLRPSRDLFGTFDAREADIPECNEDQEDVS